MESRAPTSGRLGWIALHTGLVDPEELHASLQQQAEQREQTGESVPLGEIFRQRNKIPDLQLRRLVMIQQGWRFACGALAIDGKVADSLASRLAVEGRFDMQTLWRLRQPETLTEDPEMVWILAELGIEVPGVEMPRLTAPKKRAADDTSPRPGQLGWIALRKQLVMPTDLEAVLQEQYGTVEQTERPRIGDMLVDAEMLSGDELAELLAIQRAWRSVAEAHSIDDEQAERLAYLLAQRGRFSASTLEGCADTAGMSTELRLIFAQAGILLA